MSKAKCINCALILSILLCVAHPALTLASEVSTASVGECKIKNNKDGYIKEIANKSYLYQVVRYLYRWYLDEIDLEKIVDTKNIDCYIRLLHPKLDENDKSQYAEILFVGLDIAVKVKKADYYIDELKQPVKSDSFRIIDVYRFNPRTISFSEYDKVLIDVNDMKKYLFKTRNTEEAPLKDITNKINKIFYDQLVKLRKYNRIYDTLKEDNERNVLHVAPFSAIRNDIWAYWESGRILIKCTSDMDISKEDAWRQDKLLFRFYDAYNNTVVSFGEVALSNELMTRYQVGRILYNCIVLGKRVQLKNKLK